MVDIITTSTKNFSQVKSSLLSKLRKDIGVNTSQMSFLDKSVNIWGNMVVLQSAPGSGEALLCDYIE